MAKLGVREDADRMCYLFNALTGIADPEATRMDRNVAEKDWDMHRGLKALVDAARPGWRAALARWGACLAVALLAVKVAEWEGRLPEPTE